MSSREPANTSARARLTAKRELLIEAVRAWMDELLDPDETEGTTKDLVDAWRDYLAAEKKA